MHWYRVLLLEAQGGRLSAREWQDAVKMLPFICVTDSKSLYDTVNKCILILHPNAKTKERPLTLRLSRESWTNYVDRFGGWMEEQ